MTKEAIYKQGETRELLRFATAGGVDDGKSTLIGRLLHDAKSLYQDQLASIQAQKPGEEPVWAHLTDGLRSEREQGITIDVAYRFFETKQRKFIIADSPGHEQYTRNMATAASTADLAVILIDARHGLRTQSRRHAFIAALTQVPHLVVAVNKMDLVDYSPEVFKQICDAFADFAARLEVHDIRFVPISALVGENVVHRSKKMPWYQGPSLLGLLETVHIASDRNLIDLRFPIQYVLRPNQDFRGYAGTLAGGVVRKGDEVHLHPSGQSSRIASVLVNGQPSAEAFASMAVVLTLEDQVDAGRGDMLVHAHNRPKVSNQFEAMVVWFDQTPLHPQGTYLLRHTTREVRTRITNLHYRVDVNSLTRQPGEFLGMNEIGRVAFETLQPLFFDAYQKNRATGSFILIDELNHRTLAAGMIAEWLPVNPVQEDSEALPEDITRPVPIKPPTKPARMRPALWMVGTPPETLEILAIRLRADLRETHRPAIIINLNLENHDPPQPASASLSPLTTEVLQQIQEAGLIAIILSGQFPAEHPEYAERQKNLFIHIGEKDHCASGDRSDPIHIRGWGRTPAQLYRRLVQALDGTELGTKQAVRQQIRHQQIKSQGATHE